MFKLKSIPQPPSVKAPALTMSSPPHIKHPDNTRTLMLDVLIALTPAYVWGVYIFGLRALVLGVISVFSCVLFEAGAVFVLRRLNGGNAREWNPAPTILDLSAVVTGTLLAMNLPVSAPLWLPVIGSAFAIIVVKQLYGGIGKNIFNPALSAVVFLTLLFPAAMTNFTAPHTPISPLKITLSSADIVAAAPPLAALKQGVFPAESMFTLLIGDHAGTIGEVSTLLLIAGGIYLLVRRVISWRIPVAFMGAVGLITIIFPKVALASDVIALSFAMRQLTCGGLALGAIFMATDYATSPVTPAGRLIYGVGCGIITVIIRYYGVYTDGVPFAILIMNIFVWYLDRYAKPKYFGWTKPSKGAVQTDDR